MGLDCDPALWFCTSSPQPPEMQVARAKIGVYRRNGSRFSAVCINPTRLYLPQRMSKTKFLPFSTSPKNESNCTGTQYASSPV